MLAEYRYHHLQEHRANLNRNYQLFGPQFRVCDTLLHQRRKNIIFPCLY